MESKEKKSEIQKRETNYNMEFNGTSKCMVKQKAMCSVKPTVKKNPDEISILCKIFNTERFA